MSEAWQKANQAVREAVLREMASPEFRAESADPAVALMREAILGATPTSAGPAAGGKTVQARFRLAGKARSASFYAHLAASRSREQLAEGARKDVLAKALDLTGALEVATTPLAAARVAAALPQWVEEGLRTQGYTPPDAPPERSRLMEASTQIGYAFWKNALEKEVTSDTAVAAALDALSLKLADAVLAIPSGAAADAASRARLKKAREALLPAIREAMAAGMGEQELEDILNRCRVENVHAS